MERSVLEIMHTHGTFFCEMRSESLRALDLAQTEARLVGRHRAPAEPLPALPQALHWAIMQADLI